MQFKIAITTCSILRRGHSENDVCTKCLAYCALGMCKGVGGLYDIMKYEGALHVPSQ